MNATQPAPPSNFVTVLAWIMIVFGALGILLSLLQNVMMSVLLPVLQSAMPQGPGMPPFPVGFFRVLMLLGLGITMFMTYAAWSLLKRRNWARIIYVVLFVIGAAGHVIVALLFGLGFGLAGLVQEGAGQIPEATLTAMKVMGVAFAIFMLVMAVLYVWLVQRLLSPAIKAEFGVPDPAV